MEGGGVDRGRDGGGEETENYSMKPGCLTGHLLEQNGNNVSWK